MTTETNMDYEECRLRLYRLASISPEATARVGRVIERELVQLGASAANLSPEETECCARVGLKAEDLAAHKAKEAEITRVLAKVSTEDMVVLRCLVGEDRAAQASRYIALKGLR
jgi:hypothetical protein